MSTAQIEPRRTPELQRLVEEISNLVSDISAANGLVQSQLYRIGEYTDPQDDVGMKKASAINESATASGDPNVVETLGGIVNSLRSELNRIGRVSRHLGHLA